MNGLLRRHGEKVPLIGDVLCCILVFPICTTFLDKAYAPDTGTGAGGTGVGGTGVGGMGVAGAGLDIWLCLMFATMALARLFRAFRLRARSRSAFVANLIYSAVYAICAVLPAAFGYIPAVSRAVELLFWATMIAERVRSIMRKRKLWNIVANALAILLMAVVALFVSELVPMAFEASAAAYSALLTILIVIFSRIRLDVLREIVRKTYAAEIILGLLLLMVAFSFALKFVDDTFQSFWDALWYCFAVVTTIGFGDITPANAVGRAITVILGVYGIVVVALITSIIVNFYGEMKRAGAGESAPAPAAGTAPAAVDPADESRP